LSGNFLKNINNDKKFMQVTNFYYNLPKELIAQRPLDERSSSRLLCLDRRAETIQHKIFNNVLDALNEHDLLVFNNSRVIPARLLGQKSTGGKIEILVERILDHTKVLAHVRSSKSPKPDSQLLVDDLKITVMGRQADLFILQFELQNETVLDVLEKIGHMPLPPYIERLDEISDRERYQTVYAKPKGSVAAPTAGLHFDESLLAQLKDKGVETAFVTLHVGAGTFQPVRVQNILEHHMHAEWIDVSQSVCDKIAATKAKGGRVIAVGTTSVRCLETASQSGALKPYLGETEIFIYPGYEFKTIDGMITNFHLPESTLLMLVCAFGGYDFMMRAYEEAVKEKYRFFSYGDAMLIV